MENTFFYILVAISLAVPIILLVGSIVFLWGVTKRFSEHAKSYVISKALAILTAVICGGYTLYGIYSIYGPILLKTEHVDTNGIIIILGPTMYGFYSAVLAVVVGLFMLGVSKIVQIKNKNI